MGRKPALAAWRSRVKGLGAETANVFFAEAPEPTRAGERNLQDPAVRDSLEELGRVTSTNLLYWLAAADAKEGKKREDRGRRGER